MQVALVGTGVHPIPPTGYGGVERTLGEFAVELRRAGHHVDIVQRPGHGRSRDEYRFALGLPGQLREVPYDVLHASTPVVANRLAWAGIPYVYTTHSRHWFWRHGLSERWGYWLERRGVRDSLATIALTERIDSAMGSARGPTMPRLHPIIPIGVDLERFQPDLAHRTGNHALGVGVVAPFKRWELAAAAAREAGWSFSLAGPIGDAAYARQLRESGTDVELLGEVADTELVRRLASADALLHPSAVEILPGVVLQALASGVPVLGADPIASLVTPGETGWTARAGADAAQIVRALGDGLRRLAQEPALAQRMSASARAEAEERFGWDSVVTRHVALYEELLREGAFSRRRRRSA
ncbi:MAG: glycosyltransferase family 4 protein [Thermoplasmata archaeon]|nr:glycosyltransferase family 4 protein [Thermoplasmata archaeon]